MGPFRRKRGVNRVASEASRRRETAVQRNVDEFVQEFDLIARADEVASLMVHRQHLETFPYSVAPGPMQHKTNLRNALQAAFTESTAVVIVLSWKQHDLNFLAPAEHLDLEIEQLKTFFTAVLGFEVRHIVMPKKYTAQWLKSTLEPILRNLASNATLIVYYSGHGSTDETTRKFTFGSNKGGRVAWEPIARQIMRSFQGQTLVVLDACQSGGAISSFEDDALASGDIPPGTNIMVLSAASWKQDTAAFGPETLTQRFAKAATALIHRGDLLSVFAIAKLIGDAAVWDAMGAVPTLRTIPAVGAYDIVLQPRYHAMFAALHDWLLDNLMPDGYSLKDQEWGSLVVLKRYGFSIGKLQHECGDLCLEVVGNPTVRDAISLWHSRTRLKSNTKISLPYFDHVLDPDADLLTSIVSIKNSHFKDDRRNDNVYGIAVVIIDPLNLFGGVATGCLKTGMCRLFRTRGEAKKYCKPANGSLHLLNGKAYADPQAHKTIDGARILHCWTLYHCRIFLGMTEPNMRSVQKIQSSFREIATQRNREMDHYQYISDREAEDDEEDDQNDEDDEDDGN